MNEIAGRNIWLVVQRLDNYENDKRTGFYQLGFPERYRSSVAKMRKGDLLVMYVASRISCFTGLRRIMDETSIFLDLSAGYDDIFPLGRNTEPVVDLPKDDWIEVRNLIGQLDIISKRNNWQAAFRQALRQLTTKDGEFILALMSDTAAKLLASPEPPHPNLALSDIPCQFSTKVI